MRFEVIPTFSVLRGGQDNPIDHSQQTHHLTSELMTYHLDTFFHMLGSFDHQTLTTLVMCDLLAPVSPEIRDCLHEHAICVGAMSQLKSIG
jgi:hypothetical protein